MHTPVLLGVDGETRSLIETYNSGIFFEPENEADFIKKLLLMHGKMSRDPKYFHEGCKKMSLEFDRSNLARKMLAVLKGDPRSD